MKKRGSTLVFLLVFLLILASSSLTYLTLKNDFFIEEIKISSEIVQENLLENKLISFIGNHIYTSNDLQIMDGYGGGECDSNEDCGTDGYYGDNYCFEDNVYRNNITFTCNNPVSAESTCSNETTPHLIEECSYGCEAGVCSECEESIINTTWSEWQNLTCISEQINQSRNRTEYDANFCGTFENVTHYEYQLEGPTYQNTSWSEEWLDVACVGNDMNKSKNLTQYDIYGCAENTTFFNYSLFLADIQEDFTDWVNEECLNSTHRNQSRNKTEYDANFLDCSENITTSEYQTIEDASCDDSTPTSSPSGGSSSSATPLPEQEAKECKKGEYEIEVILALDPEFIKNRIKKDLFSPNKITPFYDISIFVEEKYNKEHEEWINDNCCQKPNEQEVCLYMTKEEKEWEVLCGLSLELSETKYDSECIESIEDSQDWKWKCNFYNTTIKGWLQGWVTGQTMEELIKKTDEGWQLTARIQNIYEETENNKEKCYPEEIQSPKENIDLCVQLWGPDGKTKAPGANNFLPPAKYPIVTMRSESSKWLAKDVINKALNNIEEGYHKVDPLAYYKESFSHFVDLKKHIDRQDQGWTKSHPIYFNKETLEKISTRSRCYNKRLHNIYGKNMHGIFAYTTIGGKIIISGKDSNALTAIHETAHALFYLDDTYPRGGARSSGINKWSTRQKISSEEYSPLPFLPEYGKTYNIEPNDFSLEKFKLTKSYEVSKGVKASNKSIMDSLTNKFNLWEASHIKLQILYDYNYIKQKPVVKLLKEYAQKIINLELDIIHESADYKDIDLECISKIDCKKIANNLNNKGSLCIGKELFESKNNKCIFADCFSESDCPNSEEEGLLNNLIKKCEIANHQNTLLNYQDNKCVYAECFSEYDCPFPEDIGLNEELSPGCKLSKINNNENYIENECIYAECFTDIDCNKFPSNYYDQFESNTFPGLLEPETIEQDNEEEGEAIPLEHICQLGDPNDKFAKYKENKCVPNSQDQ